jgi:surface protein
MADGIDSLSRELASVNIAPEVPPTTAAPTHLAPPPPVWETLVPHAVEQVVPAAPIHPPVGQEEPVDPWIDMMGAKGEPSVFNPIPFVSSFDTSSVTTTYVGLPFPSKCLDSKEEDDLSFALDFFGLRDPESML